MDFRKLIDLTKEIGYWQLLPDPFGMNSKFSAATHGGGAGAGNGAIPIVPQPHATAAAAAAGGGVAVPPALKQSNSNTLDSLPAVVSASCDPIRDRSHPVTMRYHALLKKTQKHQEQLRLLDSMIDTPGVFGYPMSTLPSQFSAPIDPVVLTRGDRGGGLADPTDRDGDGPSSPIQMQPPTLLPPIPFPNTIHLGIDPISNSRSTGGGGSGGNEGMSRVTVEALSASHHQKQHPASYLSDIYRHTVVLNEATNKERLLQKDRNNLLLNFVKDGGDLWGAFNGMFMC